MLIHHDFYKDEIKKARQDGEKQVATMKEKAMLEIDTMKEKAMEEITTNKEEAEKEINKEINTKKRLAEDQLRQVKIKFGR